MQWSIHFFEGPIAAELGWLAGWVLLISLLLQGLLGVSASMRRVYAAREQRSLTRKRLEIEIQTALAKCRQAEVQQVHWNGYRKFQVSKKHRECENVYSFYLSPHDRKPLPPFKPGQYLTFQLGIPGQERPVIRCYSLSDSPGQTEYYRVTIKKVVEADGRLGLASSYFADHVKEGDILNVKAPSGHFFLDLTQDRPVVLVGAGVGITPVLSMLNALVEARSKREIHFVFGARSGRDHIQRDHVKAVAAAHENVHPHICYTRPEATDKHGDDYHHVERVSIDLLKKILPSNNYDFFLCGPGGMMESVVEGLRTWGVPDENIFFEAFGPATVKKVAAPAPSIGTLTSTLQVTFSRSNKVCTWNSTLGSLLDLAEAQGVKVDSGCRAGNCGSCILAIKSGAVNYISPPGSAAEDGSCLACVAQPKTSLVLDA